MKTDGSGKAEFQNVPQLNTDYTLAVDAAFGFAAYKGGVKVNSATVSVPVTMTSVNDVILDRILDDSQGQLSPGMTVFYPTMLRFQGRYRVVNRQTSSTYQPILTFLVNGSSTQPKLGFSSPPAITDVSWELDRNVIGQPCQSVNGGTPSCFDHTDQLQMDLAEFPAAVLLARQGPFGYALKYVAR